MADKLDNLKKANGFDKNPQNINQNGRPKKVVTKLKELGYSKIWDCGLFKYRLAIN